MAYFAPVIAHPQQNDGDGCAGEKKERKTEAEVVGFQDSIRNDLSERELSQEEEQDRAKWRRLMRNVDPT